MCLVAAIWLWILNPICELFERFHVSFLLILGLHSWDKVPHVEIQKRSKSTTIGVMLVDRELRWFSHVTRMPENRLPRRDFLGEFKSGEYGCRYKRYGDHGSTLVKIFNIFAGQLEKLACDRTSRRRVCIDVVQTIGAKLAELTEERCRRRNHSSTATQVFFRMPYLRKIPRLRVGLINHTITHLPWWQPVNFF